MMMVVMCKQTVGVFGFNAQLLCRTQNVITENENCLPDSQL